MPLTSPVQPSQRSSKPAATAVYPLAPLQASMLAFALNGGSAAYNLDQLVLTFAEGTRADRWEAIWHRIFSAEPALQLRFRWPRKEEPQALPEPERPPELRRLDWGKAEGDLEKRLEALLAADRAEGFDLATAPLWRLYHIRLPTARSVLVWSYHHILLDGTSVVLVVRRALQAYAAMEAGASLAEAVSDSPEPDAFARFARWVEGSDHATAAEYFAERFADHTPAAEASFFREPPSREIPSETANGVIEKSLAREETDALEAFAAEGGVTLHTLLQGAWARALGCRLGAEAVPSVTIKGGRYWDGAKHPNALGLFIRPLALRLEAPAEAGVVDWLRSLRRHYEAASVHDFAFLDAVRKAVVRPDRDLRFETGLMLLYGSWEEQITADLPRWSGMRARLEEQSQYFAFLAACRTAEGLRLSLEYDRARLPGPMAERLLGHVVALLQSFPGGKGATVGALPSLAPEEAEALETVLSGPSSPEFLGHGLHELFFRAVSRHPTAMVFCTCERRWTYAEAARVVDHWSRQLRAQGIPARLPIGIIASSHPETVLGLLAILRAGHPYVPLHLAQPRERIAHILTDTGLRWICVRSEEAETVADWGVERFLLPTPRAEAPGAVTEELGPFPPVDPSAVANLLYTSGSTGLPKGVANTHEGLANEVLQMGQRMRIGPTTRTLQLANIAFDGSIEEIMGTLAFGGCVVFRPGAIEGSWRDFHALLETEGITHLDLTTSFWHQWIEDLRTRKVALPAALETVVVGGEKVTRSALETWVQLNADARVAWFNTYGPTEAAIVSTVYEPPREGLEGALETVPIGSPLANVDLAILAPGSLRPVPWGVAGELCIGGAGVAEGYLNRPDLNRTKFVADPRDPTGRARHFRTADRVRLNKAGQIEFLGRLDRLVKMRGFRIELTFIESELESLAPVQACRVRCLRASNHQDRLVAYVVRTAEGASTTAEDLRALLQGSLQPQEMPTHFLFLDKLPLNRNGKVDERALPEPQLGADRGEVARTEALNPLEDGLLEAFRSVLKLPELGPDDHFFQWGGDSISVIALLGKIEIHGLRATDIYEHPTAVQLAAFVAVQAAVVDAPRRWSPISLVHAAGRRPPLNLIHTVDGSCGAYGPLVGHLGTDQPVRYFEARGVHDFETRHRSIPEMAAEYVEHLLRAERGPYRLAGWCFGGNVAWEMATQLRLRGETVSHLILIDAFAPPSSSRRLRVGHRLRKIRSFFVKRPPAQFAYLREKWQEVQDPDKRRVRFESLKPCYNNACLRANYDANSQILDMYEPTPSDQPVHLLMRCLKTESTLMDPDGYWPLLSPAVSVHRFRVSHRDLLREPHAAQLATAMTELLRA